MSLTLVAQPPIISKTYVPGVTGIAEPSSHRELDALCEGVRALASGAFHRLYELEADALNSFAYSIVQDAGAAEDAVQQAFLELVKAAPGFQGDGRSLRAWLFRSVRYRCLDELRRRRRRPESLQASVPDRITLPPTDEGGGVLAEALAQLTERQRQVLILRHVVGMSGAEVAEVLSTNRAAVFAAAARAERRMRHLLKDPRGATT
jgi:RNA polymerase sigma-70 factor (ECF subfamily)